MYNINVILQYASFGWHFNIPDRKLNNDLMYIFIKPITKFNFLTSRN